MSAVMERTLRDVHADEYIEASSRHEWEPQNEYIETLRKFQVGQVIVPASRLTKGEIHFLHPHEYVKAVSEVASRSQAAVRPVESIQAELAKCMVARPHESIELGSKLGIVSFVFMLLVYFVGGVLIVNPVVCFFGILGCTVFWIMARADRRRYHHR